MPGALSTGAPSGSPARWNATSTARCWPTASSRPGILRSRGWSGSGGCISRLFTLRYDEPNEVLGGDVHVGGSTLEEYDQDEFLYQDKEDEEAWMREEEPDEPARARQGEGR